MSPDLLRAILAMDSYNRGYNQGVLIDADQIGNATFYKDALDATMLPDGAAMAIGFYAAAYSIDGGGTVVP